MAGQAKVGSNGRRLAIRAVSVGDGAGVEVREPDHDLVRVRASRRVRREEVVRDVGNNRPRAAL